MIVGDPSVFAIESEITRAYERLSFRALGYFVIYVCGRSYGVRAPDATMLACSFDAVEKRIANRGKHVAPFAAEDAGKIADAFLRALYADKQEDKLFFGIPQPEFSGVLYSKYIVWAPDGDEAFVFFSSGMTPLRPNGWRCQEYLKRTMGRTRVRTGSDRD
jgi:hypothetical protein